MALQMYLKVKTWASPKSIVNRKVALYHQIREGTGITTDPPNQGYEIVATVGYWEDASAIHGWFCRHIHPDVDKGYEFYVSPVKLAELREHCRETLELHEFIKAPSFASIMFPAGAHPNGYDEAYFDSLRETVEIIERVLNDPTLDDIGFYYQATW